MKKVTAIFFICFLSLSQVGHVLIYYVQLYQVKKLVKEQIVTGVPQSFCEVVEDTDLLRWEEEGEEFTMNGNMYDVVAVSKINGKKVYYCLNDTKEEDLVRNFSQIIKGSSSKEKGSDPYASRFHITDQFISCTAVAILFSSYGNIDYYSQDTALHYNYWEVHIPPPRYLHLS